MPIFSRALVEILIHYFEILLHYFTKCDFEEFTFVWRAEVLIHLVGQVPAGDDADLRYPAGNRAGRAFMC